MAYSKTNKLIMRRVPTGVGDWFDDVKSAGSSVLNFYNTAQQNKGATAATTQSNKDLAAALAAKQGGGLDTTTLAIGGLALAGVLFFALRK